MATDMVSNQERPLGGQSMYLIYVLDSKIYLIFSAGQLRGRDTQQDRLTMIALNDGSQVIK